MADVGFRAILEQAAADAAAEVESPTGVEVACDSSNCDADWRGGESGAMSRETRKRRQVFARS